ISRKPNVLDSSESVSSRMAQPKHKKDMVADSGHAGDYVDDSIRLGDEANGLFRIAAGIGVVGIVLAVVLGGGLTRQQFQHSYLTAFMWGLSIGAGALWWVTLQHLVGARWSVAVRRVGELLAHSLVLMALLSLPVVLPMLLGNDSLYRWVSHEYMASEH